MDLYALIDPAEYERQYPSTEKNGQKRMSGPLANHRVSGTWKMEDMLSDESLAALYRAKLKAQGKID